MKSQSLRHLSWLLCGTLSVAVSLAQPGCEQAGSDGSGDASTDPNQHADLAASGSPDGMQSSADGMSGSDLGAGSADMMTASDMTMPPTVSAACDSHAQAACDKYKDCYPSALALSFPSMTSCLARYKQQCLLYASLSGSKRTTTDIQRCASLMTTLTCIQYADQASYIGTACSVTGTLANGTACGASDQCTSGYCNLNYTTGCGVCASYVKVGAVCDFTTGSPTCEPGAGCVGPAGSRTCQKLAALGAACNAVSGPSCLPMLACRGGVCAASRAAGDTCDPTIAYDCDYTKDLNCNGTTKKCEKIYSYLAAGASCGSATSAPYPVCAAGSRCSSTTGTGTCVAPAADGAACVDSPGTPGCLWPAQCKSGTCQLPSPASCK